MTAKTARTLKTVAVSYLIKTLLIAIAWIAVPDLPARALGAAEQTFAWMAGITD